MNTRNTIASASLAFAVIAGAFAPYSAVAGTPAKHISIQALKKNSVPGRGHLPNQANPLKRPCSKTNHCNR